MRILPGKMELAVSIIERSVIPLLRDQKGFVNIMLMENRDRNELIGLTIWETERDMLLPERCDFLEQQAWKLNTVLAEGATAVNYEHRLPVQIPVQMASETVCEPESSLG